MIDGVQVIDFHGHVGRWDRYGMLDDPALMLHAMDAAGIDRSCVNNVFHPDGTTGNETRIAIDQLSLMARDAESPVNAEFRGSIDGIAVALTGNLGPLATLAQRRLPYPVMVQGEVDGRKAAVAAKVKRADGVVVLVPQEQLLRVDREAVRRLVHIARREQMVASAEGSLFSPYHEAAGLSGGSCSLPWRRMVARSSFLIKSSLGACTNLRISHWKAFLYGNRQSLSAVTRLVADELH